jgi:small-conductance mechanosensitive channel
MDTMGFLSACLSRKNFGKAKSGNTQSWNKPSCSHYCGQVFGCLFPTTSCAPKPRRAPANLLGKEGALKPLCEQKSFARVRGAWTPGSGPVFLFRLALASLALGSLGAQAPSAALALDAGQLSSDDPGVFTEEELAKLSLQISPEEKPTPPIQNQKNPPYKIRPGNSRPKNSPLDSLQTNTIKMINQAQESNLAGGQPIGYARQNPGSSLIDPVMDSNSLPTGDNAPKRKTVQGGQAKKKGLGALQVASSTSFEGKSQSNLAGNRIEMKDLIENEDDDEDDEEADDNQRQNDRETNNKNRSKAGTKKGAKANSSHRNLARVDNANAADKNQLNPQPNNKDQKPKTNQTIYQAHDPNFSALLALQKDLSALQQRLGQILSPFEKQRLAGPGPVPTDLNSFLVQHIDRFGIYLKYRAQELLHGLRTISQSIKTPPPHSPLVARYGLGLLGGGLAGLALAAGLRWSLSRRLSSLAGMRRRPVLERMALISSLLFLPLVLAFLLSVITGMSMAMLRVPVSSVWRLNACALVPLHIYMYWACTRWARIVFSSDKTKICLLPINTATAEAVNRRIRLSAAWYGLSMVALVVAELFALDSAVMHALLDGCVLGVSLILWSALALTRSQLTNTKDHRALIRLLYVLRLCVSGLCLFWLLGKQMAVALIVPFLETLFVLMAAKLWDYSLQRARLKILWSFRHQRGWMRDVLVQKGTLRRLLRYSIYALLIAVWAPHVWPNPSGENIVWTVWIAPLLNPGLLRSVLNASLIFLGASFLTKASDRILRYYVEEKYTSDTLENNFLASRLKTLMAMLKTVLRIVIWLPAISIILSVILAQFGENISIAPWISSIGAASFGLTFGVQNVVRDFITGFFIILENNMMVGDEVQIDAHSGKVETITIRTLKIRTDTGTLLTIPFGSISVIGNKNRDFSAIVLNISVGYDEDVEKVQTLIERAFVMLKKTPFFARQILGSMEMRGIAEVTGFSVVFQIKIKTIPNVQDTVKRAFTRHLKALFDEAGIKVPNPAYAVPRAMPSLTQTPL